MLSCAAYSRGGPPPCVHWYRANARPAVLRFRYWWPGDPGSIDVPPGVTLSRKGAKSRTRSRKHRSTGTRARTRVDRMRKPSTDLEQQLESCRRELAEAREQQTATSEVLRVISSSPIDLPTALGAIAESAARLPIF